MTLAETPQTRYGRPIRPVSAWWQAAPTKRPPVLTSRTTTLQKPSNIHQPSLARPFSPLNPPSPISSLSDDLSPPVPPIMSTPIPRNQFSQTPTLPPCQNSRPHSTALPAKPRRQKRSILSLPTPTRVTRARARPVHRRRSRTESSTEICLRLSDGQRAEMDSENDCCSESENGGENEEVGLLSRVPADDGRKVVSRLDGKEGRVARRLAF